VELVAINSREIRIYYTVAVGNSLHNNTYI
jgi:hypothetical protein